MDYGAMSCLFFLHISKEETPLKEMFVFNSLYFSVFVNKIFVFKTKQR